MNGFDGRKKRPPRHHHETPDTTAEFRRLADLPDGRGKEELRQRVVRAWVPVAHRLAWRYRDRGESLEDLQQVAALGLVKAVIRYDPHRGTDFESYAVPTIAGEIKRHFRDLTWDVHVPRRVQQIRNRVRVALRELGPELSRSPTVAQVAEYTGLSEEDVLLGMEALESYSALSLDAEPPGGDFGRSLGDTLGACEPGFDLVVQREAVKPYLRRLPERERRILYLRYFCYMSQSRIAEELGMSQMHVSRLLRRACDGLRQRVENRSEP
ncbi:SigB/SigF/SigG family RNA polymerase sigma factor [Streptomyces gobiensis]|uniref:SigB/SigF/SigG family RNA polymerase sigma factor n=1 Tax=Streptomyces gobiensis TaxID=2875706 RepID=UPI001E43210D|nr:SigB/SigF/SigG family RNA polymerase sigma factor [Streptomyces gobiensis]UGY91609.1 SigB/SigF/SigG family RNA polymerase sigma factor [Streptomyces gobiensis]